MILPNGEPCGKPLSVVAPIMGNTSRHKPRRPLCVLHLRLDTPELDDRGHPFELFQMVMASRYPTDEFYSGTVKFNCEVKRNKVVADQQDEIMRSLAVRVQQHFKQ